MAFEYYCENFESNCCKNWTIFTKIGDIRRIAQFTKKNPTEYSEFSKIPDWEILEYSQKAKFHFYNLAESGFILQLKKIDNNCIFLAKNRCQIYGVRPYICQLYPFWFVRQKNCFTIIPCIGYKNVCIIPEDLLNSYKRENQESLLMMARKYYQEMKDYKVKIKSFVKKYFKEDVYSI